MELIQRFIGWMNFRIRLIFLDKAWKKSARTCCDIYPPSFCWTKPRVIAGMAVAEVDREFDELLDFLEKDRQRILAEAEAAGHPYKIDENPVIFRKPKTLSK